VQAAVLADHLEAGPQPQVKGVAEQDLRPARRHLVGRHRLHRAVGAHRHERRRVDASVGELEHSAPGRAVALRNRKPQEIPSISMASP
jgi:hypothetical protein